MKTNLFAIIVISGLTFACGGRMDNKQGGIVGVSGVAGQASSFAGADSTDADTSSTGGTFEISAGGTTSVGGSISETATGGTTELPCAPEVQVRYLSHGTANVEPGAKDVATLKFQLTATCVDQEVESIAAHIGGLGYEVSDWIPFRSSNGENFRNVRYIDVATNTAIGKPILPIQGYSVYSASIDLTHRFTLLKNTPIALEIRLDVSSTFLTDSMKNQYLVRFDYINIKDGGSIPIIISYANEFDTTNWPLFTVTSGSCRLEKTVPLSVYTTYNDLVGTPASVIVHGYSKSSDGSGSNSSEIQSWNPETQTINSQMVVGVESKLLLESGSDQGFMAMINSPRAVEQFPGDFSPLRLSFYDKIGAYRTDASIWSTAPRNDQITAVTGSKVERIIWIDDRTDYENPTIQSWAPSMNPFKPNKVSINVYNWLKDGTKPLFLSTNAVTNNQKTAVGIGYGCAVITPEGNCPLSNDIIIWDEAQTSPASTMRISLTGDLRSLYASKVGFDAIIINQEGMHVSKYDWNGNFLGRVNLPPKSRVATAFRGGYAVITTSPDSLKNFEFILVDADGTIKQTIPFKSDFDRYELAIGNLVVSGTGTLAFSWSGLGQTTLSSLAFFSCQ